MHKYFFRVERFARAAWGGLNTEINGKTGTLTLLKGSYILSRVASFEILANQEGDSIYLQAGGKVRPSPLPGSYEEMKKGRTL